MNVRAALAFAGSATAAAALDGAARALTAAPPALTLCAGVALIVIASQGLARRTFALALLGGACAGLWLSSAAPSGPRDVIARAPRGHVAADLFDALDALDANPAAFDARTITVSGTWTPASARGAASVSRRVMSCCAADAVDVGFDVAPNAAAHVRAGAWVGVSGRVRVRLRNGEMRYELGGAVVVPAPPR
ncbi:MAG TPA: hypothetical protein VII69_00870 [Candidatus Eremiobacteraceae bacterium]